MDTLERLLKHHVDDGLVPGAVALVSSAAGTEVAVVGHRDLAGTVAMTRDTLFRIASVTKPVTAAAVLSVVEERRIALRDPVSRWLPEIADPQVVRTPGAPADDVVPVARPVTVEDLLTMRAGWGWASDFELPAIAVLADRVERRGVPHDPRTPQEWLSDLAEVPMLYQPGEAWLYNTCSDLQGVLLSRVLDRPLPEIVAERVLEPLGMSDTGFVVPEGTWARLAECVEAGDGGTLQVVEEPVGSWRERPGFCSGAGGLVSTLDDVARFFAMLAGGGSLDGSRVLSPDSVRAMTSDQITVEQAAPGALFLDGQGWGYGGGVDVRPGQPWNVPGRYGWVGGTGTAAYLTPGDVGGHQTTVLLTQRMMNGPDDAALVGEVCTYAARFARSVADG